MTAAEPFPAVICGYRETRITGTYECVVSDPDHACGHYLIRLNTAPQEPA